MVPGMSFLTKKPLAPSKASTLSLKSPDGTATAKVTLTDSGLTFTASKCVDRNNWCGIYKSSACAATASSGFCFCAHAGRSGITRWIS